MTRLQERVNFRITHILIGNAFIFFLITALLTVFLYGIGNFQNFTETTMLLLLKFLYWNGIVLFIFATLSTLFTLGNFLAHRKLKYLSFIVIYGVFAALGLIFMLFSGVIISLMKGNQT
ncbi:MAG: hypothetical protein LBD07_00825 [Spirochaetaceae bacterium]|jgi:hypothetical protein|nr:hypothetical protein [Spirochaetaceae bacterium]